MGRVGLHVLATPLRLRHALDRVQSLCVCVVVVVCVCVCVCVCVRERERERERERGSVCVLCWIIRDSFHVLFGLFELILLVIYFLINSPDDVIGVPLAWSGWSAWLCNATCGNGTDTRNRTCVGTCGGYCSGVSESSRSCSVGKKKEGGEGGGEGGGLDNCVGTTCIQYDE